ncbi:MAG: hypothetical protein U5N55_03875 [Cypionkella sp.]|nr:hypothetical protein [Cypionkella sp.]
MTGASKILTVSYGTFSCTLEGFDDPFSTMKAIAEYFRDLAADDRYFGAEPPVPDSAMLHRIAENATQRRVQAQVQDNGVVLRQGDAIADDAAVIDTAPALLAPGDAQIAADEAAARLAALRAEIDEKRRHIEELEQTASAAAMPPADQGAAADDVAATTIEQVMLGSDATFIEDLEIPPSVGDAAQDASAPQLISPDGNAAAATLRGDSAPQLMLPAEAAGETTPIAPAGTASKYRVEVVRGGATAPQEAAPDAQAASSAQKRPPRIIRIRRVAQTGGIGHDASSPSGMADAPADGRLTRDAEAALAAELAALDRAPAALPPLAPQQPAIPAQPKRAKINLSDDTLDKLIARANSDLDNDEVKRRQAAMSHLKAAAAVTRADRDLAVPSDQAANLDDYRNDLGQAAPDGGAPNRAAPLVLVSEQRIDRETATKRADGHLKLAPNSAQNAPLVENIFRDSDGDADVGGATTNIFTGVETFEDFVDRLGASEQIELMEAAAIYLAHVVKQPLFRRRQLIRYMSSLPDALPITRESSVQIFTQLLGLGRFAEMEPGLFAVTDRSPLLAEALREAI